MARKRLTHSQKLSILTDTDERQLGGESLRSIAESHGLQLVQIQKWREKRMELSQTKRTKKSLGPGAVGKLHQFEDEIMGWALEKRESGVPLAY